jgi:hypothetical protein
MINASSFDVTKDVNIKHLTGVTSYFRRLFGVPTVGANAGHGPFIAYLSISGMCLLETMEVDHRVYPARSLPSPCATRRLLTVETALALPP